MGASKIIGLVVGLVILVAAIYSVFFVEWDTRVPPEEPVARPLKTMVVESPFSASGRKYPGKVQANEQVQLAFQVTGQLIEFPVVKSQEVVQGELLGRLDPRDFENTLAAKQALLTQARSEYERIKGLAEREVATEKELYDSKAAYDAAVAEANIAQKALDDTRLHAPFEGIIADTYVDNFQNVNAKQPVLSLQEIESVEIVVNVPEERVVRGRGDVERYRFVATFEYLPDREFDVEVKEFSTEADPATQTYAATFVMPAPEDVLILPGMTATIREYQKEPEKTDAVAYAVPADAVPVDGQGNYFVWAVKDTGEGMGTVYRVDVQVGEMVGDDILVLAGVNPGDRLALAGVHLLQEGQQVRPFSAKGDAGQ
jgi:RND family efflux transporter MFP subunit